MCQATTYQQAGIQNADSIAIAVSVAIWRNRRIAGITFHNTANNAVWPT